MRRPFQIGTKDVLLHRAAAAWDDLVYNVARPLETLHQRLADESKRRWWSRTPAMAAGLTDRLWSIGDILRAVPALA